MKEHVTIVKDDVEDPLAIDSRIKSLENVNLDDMLKDQEVDQEMEEPNYDLESMTDNEIMSVSGNDNEDDDSEELSMADEIVADNVIAKLVSFANTWDVDTLVFAASSLQVSTMVKILNVQTLGAMRRFNGIQITKVPRVKIPNVQTLGAMRRFNDIQITKAP
nr:hypothetical protein [Tanacetum cinerariifolium]